MAKGTMRGGGGKRSGGPTTMKGGKKGRGPTTEKGGNSRRKGNKRGY